MADSNFESAFLDKKKLCKTSVFQKYVNFLHVFGKCLFFNDF
ncbi:hypothetical protein SCODD09_00235 [Streptococcus constellatus]|nr:hypothetical protein SCODD09_00235 [Streptococcus constellatus]BBD22906.1 hypothetical protein SCSC_1233 [Streptococcus constellatus subsp. constellatus]